MTVAATKPSTIQAVDVETNCPVAPLTVDELVNVPLNGSLTFTTIPGAVFIPKYAKPLAGSITPESCEYSRLSPSFSVSVPIWVKSES